MNNLKIQLFCFLNILMLATHLNCTSNKVEENDNTHIVGSWFYCKNFTHGVEISRNVCPDVIFKLNGAGIYKGTSPELNFKWQVKNDEITFSFNNSSDALLFFSDTPILKYEVTQEKKRIRLKLYDLKTKNWYLLIRDIE
jgi:hypothetical protein